jgi:glyoxylase-like metal-dependent hydrolase (beta-lactamase superfamily II)
VRRQLKLGPTALSMVTIAIAGLLSLAAACSPRDSIFRSSMGDLEDYIADPANQGASIVRVSTAVYTFHYKFNRNIIVDTAEGLVVVDPYSREASARLLQLLDGVPELRGKAVHTLIYSHFHADHTGGGELLKPREVVAHVKCPDYWKDFPAHDVLQPTRLISGDQELSVGGVSIQLLQLGMSHTDTLYAVLLPQERVLFTADQGFVRTVPPPGIAAMGYTPGYARSLDRLAALDFDVWVPSHWGYGTKQDLIDFKDFFAFTLQLCRDALSRHRDAFQRSDLEAVFDETYVRLKARYGDWHGFREVGMHFVVWAVQMTLVGG